MSKCFLSAAALILLASCTPPQHCENDLVEGEEFCVPAECTTDDDCNGDQSCDDGICWDGDECDRFLEDFNSCNDEGNVALCHRGKLTTEQCEFGCLEEGGDDPLSASCCAEGEGC